MEPTLEPTSSNLITPTIEPTSNPSQTNIIPSAQPTKGPTSEVEVSDNEIEMTVPEFVFMIIGIVSLVLIVIIAGYCCYRRNCQTGDLIEAMEMREHRFLGDYKQIKYNV